jgi:hypothetical protein
MDTGMTELPAAAATVTIIIKFENLSRMMVSFGLAATRFAIEPPKTSGQGMVAFFGIRG